MVELRNLRPSGRLSVLTVEAAVRTNTLLAWPRIIVLLLAVGSFTGCRTPGHTIRSARDAYFAGDLATAEQRFRTLAETPDKAQVESQLDLAVIEFASGDPKSAERTLLKLREHFDALPQTVLVDDAAALATDDTRRTFELNGYEQVLLRTLLAACSLASESGDANAYCLQAQSKQSELLRESDSDEPPELTSAIALAPYLHGTLREATHQNYDDALRSFRLVSSIVPDFKPAQQDITRAGSGSHSQVGHGVLYVLAFVGRGPQLVEREAPTTSAALQIASTILRSVQKQKEGQDDQPVLPNIAAVKIPVVEIPPSPIAALGVSAGGQVLGATQTLTDVGELAIAKSEAEMPWTIARAVVRRVLKEASVTTVSNSLGLSGNAAAAFEFAAINAWSGTEHADTRCWGLLPREFQVLRAELPAGVQTIELLPLSEDGAVFAPARQHSIRIEDGRNHYVFVFAPEGIVSVVPHANATNGL